MCDTVSLKGPLAILCPNRNEIKHRCFLQQPLLVVIPTRLWNHCIEKNNHS